jgi:hypothetical protein
MGWLEGYTRSNGCKGYRITSRAWTRTEGGLLPIPEGTGRLIYMGTCERG